MRKVWAFYDDLSASEKDAKVAFEASGMPFKGGFFVGAWALLIFAGIYDVLRVVGGVLPVSAVASWMREYAATSGFVGVAIFALLYVVRLFLADGWIQDGEDRG